MNDLCGDKFWMPRGDDGCSAVELTDCLRTTAIETVLEKIPASDFAVFRQRFSDGLCWYMPLKGKPAQVKKFPKPAAIFLDQSLEAVSLEEVTAVVAHEIAHVVLGHNYSELVTKAEVDRMDQEANDRAASWGFPSPSEHVETKIILDLKGGPLDGEIMWERAVPRGVPFTSEEQLVVMMAHHQTNGGEVGRLFTIPSFVRFLYTRKLGADGAFYLYQVTDRREGDNELLLVAEYAGLSKKTVEESRRP